MNGDSPTTLSKDSETFEMLIARIAQELLALDQRGAFIPYWEECDGLRIMRSRPSG